MLYRGNSWVKILFVILFFAAGHANAAEEKIEKFGAWFYQCKTLKIGEVCALRHVQLFKDKRPALTLTIVNSNLEDGLGIHFSAPLGVFLPDGLRVKVDSGKQRAFQYLDCIQSGCLGVIGFRKKGIAALKTGNNMQIEYTHQRGKQKITLDVPLKDFTAGLAKVSKAGKVPQKKTVRKKAAPKVVTPKVATPKVVPSRPTTSKVVTPKVAPPRPATPKVVPPRSTPPKAVTPKAVTEEVATPKVVADEVDTEEVTEPEAEKSGSEGNWLKKFFSGDIEPDEDDDSEERE